MCQEKSEQYFPLAPVNVDPHETARDYWRRYYKDMPSVVAYLEKKWIEHDCNSSVLLAG